MDFLPDNYSLPTTPSRYYKPSKIESGSKVKIRVLESGFLRNCVLFYEYYNNEKQNSQGELGCPERSLTKFKATPGINEGKVPDEVWGMKVYNYETQSIQLFTIPQKTVKEQLLSYIRNEEYGDPLNYDITIGKTGQKMETRYSVIASPPKEFNKELLEGKDVYINWEAFIRSETNIFEQPELSEEQLKDLF